MVDGPEQARAALVFADDSASLRELLAAHGDRLARTGMLCIPRGIGDDSASLRELLAAHGDR